MRKLNLTKAALWCTAISPLILTACVDDSYDLSKDIDMTITVGGNLGIPGGGTEEFTLEDIMDLDDPDNSILQADPKTGNYSLLKSETGEASTIDIEGVKVDAPEVKDTPEELNFDTPTSIGQEVEAEVKDVTVEMDFTKADIENVTSVTSAAVNGTANLTLHFNSPSGINQITLKEGFTVELEMEGQTEDNTIEFDLDENGTTNLSDSYVIEGQTIRFLRDQTVRTNGVLRIPIRFERIGNFPDGQGLTNGAFHMNVNLIANGTATTPKLPSGNIQATLLAGAEVSDFILTEVTGYFAPEIGDITVDPVTIEDVPDFLNESGNQLDIKNPCIKLVFKSDAPIDVNLQGKLIRTKDGQEDINAITIGDPNPDSENAIILRHKREGVEGLDSTTYYLSRESMGRPDDEEKQIYYIEVPRIGELISNIPDEIKLEDVTAEALNEEYTIALDENGNVTTYTVEPKYELNAPLQFGPELHIEYNDTINDWQSDLEDITFKQAVVEMTALNGIPLNFGIEATAIDVDGNAIPNVKAEVEGNIKPGNKIKGGEGTATESPITVRLRSESGNIENLDGLRITLIGNTEGAADAVLNKNMSLQLTNIRIRIEGGVTMDLN